MSSQSLNCLRVNYKCDSSSYEASNCTDKIDFFADYPVSINMSTDNSGFILTSGRFLHGVSGDKSVGAQSFDSLWINGDPVAVSGNNGKVWVAVKNTGTYPGAVYECNSSSYQASKCTDKIDFYLDAPVSISMSTEDSGFILTSGGVLHGVSGGKSVGAQSFDSLGISGDPVAVSGNNGKVWIATKDNDNNNIYECSSDSYTASSCQLTSRDNTGQVVGLNFSTSNQGNALYSGTNVLQPFQF